MTQGSFLDLLSSCRHHGGGSFGSSVAVVIAVTQPNDKKKEESLDISSGFWGIGKEGSGDNGRPLYRP